MMWKAVIGYEGKYEVSSCGMVRKFGGTIVGQWIKSGYCMVRLSQPRKLMLVHRMVAEAFIPNPEKLRCVNHKDFICHNNHVENLEWCTQAYNVKYSKSAGRYPDNYWKGKRSPNAMLSDKEAQNVRDIYATGKWSYERLGKHLGISKRTVHRIVRRISYV